MKKIFLQEGMMIGENLFTNLKGKKKSIFFGFGAQADRYLINQSASNGINLCINNVRTYWFIFLFYIFIINSY